jgi:hypothetical protein
VRNLAYELERKLWRFVPDHCSALGRAASQLSKVQNDSTARVPRASGARQKYLDKRKESLPAMTGRTISGPDRNTDTIGENQPDTR